VQYIAQQNKHVSTINDLVQAQVHGRCSSAFMQGDRVVHNGEQGQHDDRAMIGHRLSERSASPGRTEERTVSVKDVQLAYCMTVRPALRVQFKDVFVAAFALDTMIKVLDRRWLYTASG
jgi:hypothetical protein